MTVSYFDSSILLSILFNEARAEDALRVWNSCPIRVSSVLLKFETNISVRRKQKSQPNRFTDEWRTLKLTALNKLFRELFFTDIDEKLENFISGYYDDLSQCKSLDAIHIASVIKIGGKYDKSQIQVCSFDNNMRSLALRLGFKVCENV